MGAPKVKRDTRKVYRKVHNDLKNNRVPTVTLLMSGSKVLGVFKDHEAAGSYASKNSIDVFDLKSELVRI